jgi:hypothetical protein
VLLLDQCWDHFDYLFFEWLGDSRPDMKTRPLLAGVIKAKLAQEDHKLVWSWEGEHLQISGATWVRQTCKDDLTIETQNEMLTKAEIATSS